MGLCPPRQLPCGGYETDVRACSPPTTILSAPTICTTWHDDDDLHEPELHPAAAAATGAPPGDGVPAATGGAAEGQHRRLPRRPVVKDPRRGRARHPRVRGPLLHPHQARGRRHSPSPSGARADLRPQVGQPDKDRWRGRRCLLPRCDQRRRRTSTHKTSLHYLHGRGGSKSLSGGACQSDTTVRTDTIHSRGGCPRQPNSV